RWSTPGVGGLRVMDHPPDVVLSGPRAEPFARGPGLGPVPPTYFRTGEAWQQYLGARQRGRDGIALLGVLPDRPYGTVGAVAIDRDGEVAAATSTGGMVMKRYGRVGDVPVIGAGTWAEPGCAVSATGWGEYFIRSAAAHEICARVRLGGLSLAEAASQVVEGVIPRLGGDGGVIAIDAQGRIAMPFSSAGMYR